MLRAIEITQMRTRKATNFMDTVNAFCHLQAAALTDVGKRREKNEDAFAALPDKGVFLVADGMGGAAAGEVASEFVQQAVLNAMDGPIEGPATRACLLMAAVNKASARIRDFAAKAGFNGTGSTVSLLVFDPWKKNQARLMTAGDSRIYRFRKGSLELLSRDHTVAALASGNGKNLPREFRGVLTRAAGLEDTVNLELRDIDIRPLDWFLICSDGLTSMLADKAIAKIIKKNLADSPETTVAKLVAAANDAGGRDNITVVLVCVDKELPPRHTPSEAEYAADEGKALAIQNQPEADDDTPTPDTITPPTANIHNSSPASSREQNGLELFIQRERLSVTGERYQVQEQLEKHGGIEIFKGKRWSDNLPVALKGGIGNQAEIIVNEIHNLKVCQGLGVTQYLDHIEVKPEEDNEGAVIVILEWLEGLPNATLRGRLREAGQALPWREVITLFNSYLSTLDALHSMDIPIIHGDLKPSNLYAPAGHPQAAKLLDLGSAMPLTQAARWHIPPGSPDYLPPEAAAGDLCRDPMQSDIFAIGCCLYEALTGKRAYPRLPRNDPENARLIRSEMRTHEAAQDFTHPIFRQNSNLQAVVAKAIALAPEKRYLVMRDLSDEFSQIAGCYE